MFFLNYYCYQTYVGYDSNMQFSSFEPDDSTNFSSHLVFEKVETPVLLLYMPLESPILLYMPKNPSNFF